MGKIKKWQWGLVGALILGIIGISRLNSDNTTGAMIMLFGSGICVIQAIIYAILESKKKNKNN